MSLLTPQVFISSTSEYAHEREAISAAIVRSKCFPYDYLQETADPQPPEKTLQTEIARSEIFVLLLGRSYGSLYPGRKTSIVEWEYEEAKQNDHVAIQPYVDKSAAGAATDPQQDDFIKRVVQFDRGHWAKIALSSDFAGLVAEGIHAWRRKALERLEQKQRGDAPLLLRMLIGTTVAVALMVTVAVIAFTLMNVARETIVVAGITGVSILIILGLLIVATLFAHGGQHDR